MPSKLNNPSDLIDKVCELMAEGQSINQICQMPGMPSKATWYRWMHDNYLDIQDKYARARDAQADYYANQIIEIADSAGASGAEVAKAKLQIDARKWVAARMAPRSWGNKVDVQVSSGKDLPTSLAEIFAQAASAGDDDGDKS